MKLSRRLACVSLCLITLTPLPTLAWGALGHRTIAGLADRQLSAAAKSEVVALLGPDNERTLVDVATWADDLHDTDPGRFRNTSRLHYVNFSSAQCNFVPNRDCRKGECVVAALDRYARILADRARPREERADALRFVVHFLADVHQPLHASYKPDKGGNTLQVQIGGTGTNLHSLWDGRLFDTTGRHWPEYVNALASTPWQEPATTGHEHDAARWAEESCRVVRDDAIYPDGDVIDDAYVTTRLPIVERRLQQAGARLAALLNRILG
ncbi:MAG: S1/P1 nuclease [Tahibacter sp.]